ncbi:VCBS repeat-containing protein [Streptomyces sp. WAC07094]|uniref:FG-GAP repeat domain-containing protein n=1 Tax=Streptomyces sp. WAC07094 TaxID=3072183 RepID=UPI002ECE92F1|nr:VCBS repeat-containing protein [Streptomyces sp. WAC07094]
MSRHAFVRLRLIAASAVLAAGLGPLLPSAAFADGPHETVVPATLRSTYTSARLFQGSTYTGHDGAGTQGVFHSLEGYTGQVWTRYADGRTVPVVKPAGAVSALATGGDVIAYQYGGGRVELWNAVDGTTRSVQTPAGLQLLTEYSDLAVGWRSVQAPDGTTVREMHLLIPDADGTTRDVPVGGLPEGVNLGAPVGGDATGLLFNASEDGRYLSIMVDRRTGQVQSLTPLRSKVYLKAQVTADHVVLFNPNEAAVQVLSRSDLSAAPVGVTLDGTGSVNPADGLAVVGDWLVHRPSAGTAVTAVPIAGGAAVTVLTSSDSPVSAVSDGTAVVVGRTTADDWGIQRIRAGADGRPAVTQVKALPKPPYRIEGLALEQGRLIVAEERDQGYRRAYGRTVAATGTPEFGERSLYSDDLFGCPSAEGACRLFATPDNRAVWLTRDTASIDRLRADGPDEGGRRELSLPAGGQITDASGRYVIHTTATQQRVVQLDNEVASVVRAPGAAALSGDVLWTAGTTPGTVTAYDLTTKKTTETLTIDAGCTPIELQAFGRWIYWTCDGKAGVYDRDTHRSVPVPADEAKLGDGFVVSHDRRAGKLTLTTVTDGTPVSRVIGDLPDTGVSQRDVRWTVDESGPNAAYVDEQERVHLVPSGVPQQALSPLDPAESSDSVFADQGDSGPALTRIELSKPAVNWRLTVRSKATGKVVDTRDGGEARGELAVKWHGTTSTGRLPNGPYDWTLSVAPADGVGGPLETKGTVRLLHGGAARHDFAGSTSQDPDGVGDLITLDSAGALTIHNGTGTGKFSARTTASGWATSIKAVPIGDLSGDRCNDVLVKLSSGAVRLYKPGCGAALKPATPYTTLVTSGWNQYDMLTSPGDVSGDGRPDLLARNASTGAVYLYKGTSAGKLSARVKLYDNWKTYKKVVGVGDLNGDGIGDLIAQDTSNVLYHYYGTGKGTFASRVRLFTGWGNSYNVVVGAGDITGDGKADIVARDTAGNLFRQTGYGNGSFAPRVKIGTGWQKYKGIF